MLTIQLAMSIVLIQDINGLCMTGHLGTGDSTTKERGSIQHGISHQVPQLDCLQLERRLPRYSPVSLDGVGAFPPAG